MNSDKDKKEYLGNILYEQIYNSPLITNMSEKEKVVSKITGMILNIDDIEKIIKISTDNELLTQNVNEALNLLNNNNYDYNS